MTIRFYCDSCEKDQPVILEPVQTDALNDGPWGDVVCAECHLVLGTMFADEPGIYTIVRQDRLSAALARAEAAEAERTEMQENVAALKVATEALVARIEARAARLLEKADETAALDLALWLGSEVLTCQEALGEEVG
jgi:hypothetical protein